MRALPICRRLAAALLLTLAPAAALADEPSSEDIIRALQPKQAKPLTRSTDGLINLDRKRRGGPAARDGKAVKERGVSVNLDQPREEAPAIDLQINFAFNSAKLSTDAEITLRNLGRALGDERLAGYRFRIEGHTDAVGSDAYNLALSDRRAASVRQYLVRNYGIEGGRLNAIGYGERRLADAARPDAAVNRRVRIVNLGEPGS